MQRRLKEIPHRGYYGEDTDKQGIRLDVYLEEIFGVHEDEVRIILEHIMNVKVDEV